MSNDIDSSDRELFRAAVGAVRKLRDDRVTLDRRRHQTAPRPRSAAATATPVLPPAPAAMIEAEDGEFVRAGVQSRQMQRLRRGQLRPEGVIDLHGLTRDAAYHMLLGFLDQSRQRQYRCVLVIHGRGLGSGEGRGVIRTSVPHWLSDDNRVLACCLAVPRDGGSGATYVLLRRG